MCDTVVMQCLFTILASLVILVPAGLYEHWFDAAEDAAHAWYASSPEELLTASEGEIEEPELFCHWVPFFEHHVQPDGHLPLNWSYKVHFAAVDPQGCRPPPTC